MTVEREVTQAKMGKLSAATLQHKPSQTYTVADRFEERAAADPERTFILFEGEATSYGRINAQANTIAERARLTGLACGDVAALMMENRPEFIATWLGLAKLGVTASLINTQLRGGALRHVLETNDAKRVFVGSECLESLETAGSRLAVEVIEDGKPLEPSPEDPDPELRKQLVAGADLFHMFTSGTTGLPKAARLSHMRFLGVGDGMSAVAEYGPDEVIACVLPLFHGAGGMVVVSCALSQNAKMSLRRRFSASAFFDDARRDGVTAFQYVGEICRYLLNQPATSRDRDHSIRVMMGAGLGPDIWDEFQERFGIERILEGWSSTEANTSLINLDNRPRSCGRIPFKELHNGRLIRYDVESDSHPRNADGFCIECETEEVGEFVGMIPDLPDSGAGRFEGYTSESATQNKILRDVFQKGDAWYRSGDLLRRDEDDYFYFVDRIGDTFRWKSENVSTQEVAESLGAFPGLAIANVYGVQVPGQEGRAGMAALVFGDPGDFDPEKFYHYVDERLPRYAAPLFLRLVHNADVTATFKLRKVDLQREGYDASQVEDPLFVRDDSAERYVELDPEALERLGLSA